MTCYHGIFPPHAQLSDRKKPSETMGPTDEIDFTSKASIVRGISSHLQCPGCNKLIQDPRILACSHTYCRSCLDKAVRKTIGGPASTNSTPASPPTASKPVDTHALDQDLRRILGSSLNKELEDSLNMILNPDFSSIGGPELSSDKASEKSANSKIQKKKAKSKGSKSHDIVSTTTSNSVTTKSSEIGAKKAPEATTSKSDSSNGQDTNKTIEVLLCPECGMQTEIPGGNVTLLPYNFFMQHVMDLMTYYSSAEPVPLVHCSMCRNNGAVDLPPAVARCSTCALFLCKECYNLHSIDDFTKLHSTLSITERGESSVFSCLTPDDTKVRNCKLHNWKPFMYFCITCSKGICEVCSKQEHKSHLFSKPENLRSDYVLYIRDLMSRTTQLRRRTENAVRTTQELMSGIQLLAATQMEEVLRTQDVLSSALDARLGVMMREVDKLSDPKTKRNSGKRT